MYRPCWLKTLRVNRANQCYHLANTVMYAVLIGLIYITGRQFRKWDNDIEFLCKVHFMVANYNLHNYLKCI